MYGILLFIIDHLNNLKGNTTQRGVASACKVFSVGTPYVDPIGPLPVRPMTSAGKRDDDFGDEELGDDLLPE